VAAALLFLQFRKPPAPAPGLTLRQLTQDSGLTTFLAISPDGKLIAYASTRSGEGDLDLWVRQLTRGAQPIRLTETWLSFSPDWAEFTSSLRSAARSGSFYAAR
jgi:Tol biopolymer transport system component